MKTKYERLSKIEKKNLYNKYKIDKKNIVKKMNNMFVLCYFGIVYSVLMFIYDLFYKHSKFNYVLDIIVFVFCLIAIFKMYSVKRNLLNDYLLKIDDKRKKEDLKKYKK